MKQRRRKKREPKRGGQYTGIFRCIKAALAGCVLTVVFILLLALLLKWEILGESSIPMVTTGIKAVCAAIAGLLCANGCQRIAWAWGGAGGLLYIVLAFVSFAIVEKAFTPSFGLFADVALGVVAGIIGGMIVKLRGK